MKKSVFFCLLLAFTFILSDESVAQFRKDTVNPNISGILTAPGADVLFGLIDPSKMHMSHSASMSYGSMGGNGMMLSSYINTIDYQISENLFLRTNLGIMTSPYNTYGEDFYLNKPRFFGGAQLQYDINENSRLFLQFESVPYGYYRPTLGDYNNLYLR